MATGAMNLFFVSLFGDADGMDALRNGVICAKLM
jgi:hypothetical protein